MEFFKLLQKNAPMKQSERKPSKDASNTGLVIGIILVIFILFITGLSIMVMIKLQGTKKLPKENSKLKDTPPAPEGEVPEEVVAVIMAAIHKASGDNCNIIIRGIRKASGAVQAWAQAGRNDRTVQM